MSADAADNGATLAEAKAWLREHIDDGARCPCCTQYAKVYRRKINSGMARALIYQWRMVGRDWVNTARLCPQYREGAKLAYWGLMEGDAGRREDGGKSGQWRITELGRQFVLGLTPVPKYARVYDGRRLSLDASQYVSIRDALGTRFDYDELMAGR